MERNLRMGGLEGVHHAQERASTRSCSIPVEGRGDRRVVWVLNEIPCVQNVLHFGEDMVDFPGTDRRHGRKMLALLRFGPTTPSAYIESVEVVQKCHRVRVASLLLSC